MQVFQLKISISENKIYEHKVVVDQLPLKSYSVFFYFKATSRTLEFFLNVFTEFSDKKYLSLKGFKPATSCVKDHGATTAQARHMCQTGSLN